MGRSQNPPPTAATESVTGAAALAASAVSASLLLAPLPVRLSAALPLPPRGARAARARTTGEQAQSDPWLVTTPTKLANRHKRKPATLARHAPRRLLGKTPAQTAGKGRTWLDRCSSKQNLAEQTESERPARELKSGNARLVLRPSRLVTALAWTGHQTERRTRWPHCAGSFCAPGRAKAGTATPDLQCKHPHRSGAGPLGRDDYEHQNGGTPGPLRPNAREEYVAFRVQPIPKTTAYWPSCTRMMSESPGSVMVIDEQRKYLPHAVPRSTLLPTKWCTPAQERRRKSARKSTA